MGADAANKILVLKATIYNKATLLFTSESILEKNCIKILLSFTQQY